MIGIFITARLGSTRLPRKHLILSEGKTMIEWLILRYKFVFQNEIGLGDVKIILTTSEKEENRYFSELLKKHDVEVCFGDDTNIPKRYFDCARKFKLDYFIVIDGDDILCSAYGSYQLLLSIISDGNYDIFKIEGLPLGLNSAAYNTNYIGMCLNNHANENLEVGWSRIFSNPKIKLITLGNYDIKGDLRFTLDYEEDAFFFKAIISWYGEKIYQISDKNLIETVISQKFDQINCHLSREYWDNYTNAVNKQIENHG